MAQYVKFEVSKDLEDSQLRALERVRKGGKIKIGSNEVTKAIERGAAKLVLIAKDVSPPEIVMHLPLLCSEKNVPFSYVSTKQALGKAAGIPVGTSSLVVTSEGDAKKEIEDISNKVASLKK